jgi:hypothetical protein
VPGKGGGKSNPQTLSSDTSATPAQKTTSHSTGVRRKNSAAIKLVAEAIVEGSDKLVAGLKEIKGYEERGNSNRATNSRGKSILQAGQ